MRRPRPTRSGGYQIQVPSNASEKRAALAVRAVPRQLLARERDSRETGLRWVTADARPTSMMFGWLKELETRAPR
jgi:hypothetical protein